MNRYLAVDIGASSGRHILGYLEKGRLVLEEIYRFPNHQIHRNGHDCWDVDSLYAHLLKGLRACHAAGKIPVSMGVDTWAVDYLLLDRQGRPLGDAVAYRDSRSTGIDRIAEQSVPFAEHYRRTGIQKQPFNTVYQLLAHRRERPQDFEAAGRLLMMPEYLHFLLTGKMVSEYTNATTTALVSARERDWDKELIGRLNLPGEIFGRLYPPGETVGDFTPSVRQEAGFGCRVVLPPTHDTACAFLACPIRERGGVVLSSGTWSLMGRELESPILSEEARVANFTNEGGYGFRYRFLKNIMGLWMLQSIRRELGEGGAAEKAGLLPFPAKMQDGGLPDFATLAEAARWAEGFGGVVDVNDSCFLSPVSMLKAVREACRRSGQPVPKTVEEVLQCVYHSLALSYAGAVRDLEHLTATPASCIHIVGGGSQDQYLNTLTARETGLTVYAGPTEGTALGNLLCQMIAAGELKDMDEARAVVHNSFAVKEFLP